jgi:hypothetical protein
MRAAAGGDTLPLSAHLSLKLDWTSPIPVDVTVTAPCTKTVKARLEPPPPGRTLSTQVPLFNETTATGADDTAVAGTVAYVMQNGAAVSGVNVGLVNT